MPPRAPAGLKAVLAHVHHTAHDFIDIGYEVRDMVKRNVRGAIKRNRMVFGITSQKDHLIFAPVGNPKAENICVKFYHAIHLSGVKDNVTNGMGLHGLGLPPILMLNNTRTQLDTAALWIKKSKTISATRLTESLWLRH
jgi:hypothetical protein